MVRIDGDPGAYASQLALDADRPAWDSETHYTGEDDDVAAFVVTLDAINFGSGYFPHLLKRPGHSGYFTVATALKERFERQGPLSAGELRRLSVGDVAELLGQPPGDEVRDELLRHFRQALVDLGEFLTARHEGSAAALVAAAGGSAQRLVASLTLMPYYRDAARYRGGDVYFYKRSQITASDLALALAGKPLGRFHDLDRLTIFADNLVPHVLRVDGLLHYAPELAARLDRGERIEAGSAAEVEIRAVALHAVEQMVAALRSAGRDVTARELDVIIWNRGQAKPYRGGSKHRTRTVYY